MMMKRLLFTLLFVSACSLTATTGAPTLPTATTVRQQPVTLAPTVDRLLNTVAATPTTAAVANRNTPNCALSAAYPTTAYTVVANLNYAQHALIARQRVSYINRTNNSLTQIVLGIEANQWPGSFKLNDVLVAAQPIGYELTGHRLTLDLPQTLEAGCALEFELVFQLNVPQIGQSLSAYRGFLGYSPRQINLGNWLPMVVPRIDGEWILRDAILIGEQTVYDIADWDVTLHIAHAPETLTIAGPGEMSQPDTRTWNFVLRGARDFTLSLSDSFQVRSALTASGATVEVYSFDHEPLVSSDGQPIDRAEHALQVAVRSLDMYEDLFGPYPLRRLAVVEGDFPDGMEFTGLVFVSHDWFTRFTGDPASFLTVITVHEVAHQWWYARVGSDQALSPWLDEALATYSEYLYIEEFYPELKEWWWSWRVNNYAPQGFVDSNVYQFNTVREYINAVYLLGARMLHDLRTDLGTEAFFRLLREYYAVGSGRIVAPDVFWSLFSEAELAATQATRRRYLRQSHFQR
jgi:hypothetical protein